MKEIIKNNKITVIIIVIIIVLAFLIGLKLLSGDTTQELGQSEDNNTNNNSKSNNKSDINTECEVKGDVYIKKYQLKYNDSKHNISLHLQQIDNKNLTTKVYIDSKLMNIINLGKKNNGEKVSCDDLKVKTYVIRSKYLGIIIGRYNNNKINYTLYVYDKRIINKNGELIFTRATSKIGEEVVSENKYNAFDDIDFDGFSFEYWVGCNNNDCKRMSVKYNGFTIEKEEIKDENEEEKIYPTV